MKGPGTLVASVIATSTLALSSSSFDTKDVRYPSFNQGTGKLGGKNCASPSNKDKFAPRFDGLRFIETLITAHR
ncbi:hypothetical protein K2173_010411 [Erythroxylum novogranatense]|uniref:Uncharacterized protein n=1 Tax=Erythroxylum novogranatense TaxID=1862640 RepID=A0AAV8TDR4_9ROSI|nr:hypothetical protein K2173_010411 [Erythroxylum novogranatense]